MPGFIITQKGDSLSGLIDYRGSIRNANICSYKQNEESEPVKYKPGDIKAYGFVNGKYYVSRNVAIKQDSATVFLEYLIDGIVDVYFYHDINGKYYFVEREGVKITMLDTEAKIIEKNGVKYLKKDTRYIGVLKNTFNKSPIIQKKVETLSLSSKNLIKIAKSYHSEVCDGEKCIIYEKKIGSVKLSFEPIVSIDFNNLRRIKDNIEYFYDEDHLTYIIPEEFAILPDKFTLKSTNFDYSIGLISSLSAPSWNENLALNLQVKYGRYKLYGEEKLTNGKIGTLFTEGKNVMNSLYLSYTFPRGMLRPVFLAGFSYSYFTSINDLRIIEHTKSIYSYILLNEYEPAVIEKNYIGIIAGAGLDIPVFRKNKISTTIQYNLMSDFSYSYTYSPLSIILGFKF